MQRPIGVLLGAVICCALFGCSGPERDDPESVVRSAMHALHDKDGDALCELSPDRAKNGPAPRSQVQDCVEAIEAFWANAGDTGESPDAPIEVTTKDRTATALVSDWQYTFSLEQIDGEWFLVGIDN